MPIDTKSDVFLFDVEFSGYGSGIRSPMARVYYNAGFLE